MNMRIPDLTTYLNYLFVLRHLRIDEINYNHTLAHPSYTSDSRYITQRERERRRDKGGSSRN